MPELPEVEVVKRSLNNKARNLIVKTVKINDGRLRYKITKDQAKKIIGLKLEKVSRRSKYLIFHFNKDILMLVHLGMTGKFFVVCKKKKRYKTSFYYGVNQEKDKKHDHVIFNLSKNQKLIYNDVRKFGFIKFFKKNYLYKNYHLIPLGPEPLSDKFNFTYFKKKIIGRNRTAKDILMDQKFVSGLGNIYVNEILYYSHVRPDRKIQLLSDSEIRKIVKFTKKILNKAISFGGSSIKDFSSGSGKRGAYQQHFCVYGKKGENCINKKCGGEIKKN